MIFHGLCEFQGGGYVFFLFFGSFVFFWGESGLKSTTLVHGIFNSGCVQFFVFDEVLLVQAVGSSWIDS